MFRLTLFLCFALFMALQIGGADHGQKRLGLLEAEEEAQADAIRQAKIDEAAATSSAEPLALAAEAVEKPVAIAFASGEPLIQQAVATVVPAVEKSAAKVEAVSLLTEDVAAPPPQEEAKILYVTGRSVNVRGGPSTDNPIVGKVSRGDEVAVIWLEDNGWARIRVEGDGVDGYVSMDFLGEEDRLN